MTDTPAAAFFPIIVKTFAGMEEVLAEELCELGVAAPHTLKRAVACEGDNNLLYRINYCCRTAVRVLKQMQVFTFTDNNDFYRQIKELPWELYLNASGTLAVDAFESESIFNNSLFIARFAKDAIADRFRERYGVRPNVDLTKPDIRVNIHIHKNTCTVLLDSSGESLHKRGYRTIQVEAPVNEVTAAGIIRLTGWKADTPFFDPMCGSGTFLIEAAMFAMKIPAGYYRKHFGFMKWKDYNADVFETIKKKADADIIENDHPIFGADVDKKNLRIARENLKNAALHHDVEVRLGAFEEGQPPFTGGLIVMNPPYGERLPLNDAISFYKTIGNTLKQKYAGFTAWIFAQENEGFKHVGLRPTRKISLYNGKLECKLLKFEMYEGKKGEGKFEVPKV
ncbi:MAG: Ribosomal RNA large subunit methyltransferase L [Bacteroidetes bacterium ADurb.Bin408]|nr:MAG: Ribosomal RNA large subunit methyltransferase L [Bacteroidetes bacterium ADurb.Bin408]